MAINLELVNAKIKAAAKKHGRDADKIKLLAVSKTKPATMIAEAIDSGQLAFGENYVQEACHKIKNISNALVEWHFLGSIQSNKTRHVASSFSWVQSVDRPSILKRLSQQRPTGLPSINVCVQINLDGEKTKSGVAAEDIEQLLNVAARLPGIKLRGLMIIPSPVSNIDLQRRVFAKARNIFDNYCRAYDLDTLSMGMSKDFEAAIAEGTTMIRLGTAVFGRREPANPAEIDRL